MKYEVVVPVYNGENAVEACLTALAEQEGAVLGKDYSILVVDDGSTDKTVEIARRFPVRIIRHGKNCGRVSARLTGARNAIASRLLFVDSRVRVPKKLIASLGAFDACPVVLGNPEYNENAELSRFERIFYLVRKKFYGKRNFPLLATDLRITPHNFRRSSKETTLLLIDRELFLSSSPGKSGNDVSDDTFLFYNLIFRKKTVVLRTSRIEYQYEFKRTSRQVLQWLFERGARFADFHLAPGEYLRKPFAAGSLTLALLFLVAACSIFVYPHTLPLIAGIVLGCHFALCAFFSEKISDFAILCTGLPVALCVFGAGACAFWLQYDRHSRFDFPSPDAARTGGKGCKQAD